MRKQRGDVQRASVLRDNKCAEDDILELEGHMANRSARVFRDVRDLNVVELLLEDRRSDMLSRRQ